MFGLDDLTHTVTCTSVTRTTNADGDSTSITTIAVATGILFAPEGLQENVSGDSAAVVGDATLYGQLPALDADDTVLHAEACCDGSDFEHGRWQVVGGSKGWGRGDVALPIRRTGDV